MNNTKALTLSIVIPVYNEEIHLEECLNAIANQTVMPDEVIVVDNNSTDKSVEIAQSYKFVKIVKEKKQGIHNARNKGFDSSKSDIIGRIDADSIIPSNWVEHVKIFYQDHNHNDYGLTGGCYFYNINTPRFAGWVQSQIAFRVNRLIMGHYILYGSNMAIPRQIWQKVRSKTCNLDNIHEDLDLAIHVHRGGFHITYDANLKVGVAMRRVKLGDSYAGLIENTMWWPNTLREHGLWTWIFGWIGAVVLVALVPLGHIANFIAGIIKTVYYFIRRLK